MLPAIEADDIISHVVQHPKYEGWQKVIVSSDKDFFQLCDDETVVYRPIQKKIVNRNNLIEEFGIHPKNFALARAIVGDASDNLVGVGGVGLKTIKNRLSFLSEDKSYDITEVMEFCENAESKVKAYQSILDGRETVMENYRLMQLYVPSISPQGTQKLNYALENFEPELGKTTILTMMIEDGFGESNLNELFAMMRKIIVDSRL
jgi:5'-3' exonuclease